MLSGDEPGEPFAGAPQPPDLGPQVLVDLLDAVGERFRA